MTDPLDKLFGSPARVKIMRLFMMNPEDVFTVGIISKSAKVSREKTKKDIKFLADIGYIKKGTRESQIVVNKKIKKQRESGFQLNSLFTYNRGLRSVLIESAPVSREILMRRFRELGRGLRFVALAGIFVGGSGLDILIVGDNIRRSRLEKIVARIESDIGKELNYVLFDTNEFRYRHSMYDKFVLNVLDSEHDVLFDSLKAGV